MSVLARLRVKLSAETQDFQAGLQNARKQTNSFRKELNKFKRSTMANVLGVTALTTGLVRLISSTAEAADRIDKMSIRTGIARSRLQELQYVGDQLGVTLDTMAGATESLTRRLPSIAQGSGPAADTLRRLGVSVRDSSGEMRQMGDLFPDILRGLSSMENDTERNALATQLFGRKAMQLIPVLEAGGDEVERLTQRANDLGLVMGDKAIADLVAYKDAMAEIKAQTGAAGRELTISMLPALNKVAPLFRAAIAEVQVFGADLALVAGYMRGIKALFTEGLQAARDEVARTREAWNEAVEQIRAGARTPVHVPVDVDIEGGGASAENNGRNLALRYVEGIEAGLETLRFNADLTRSVNLTDVQRLALQEQHALRLLDIEEQHARARHRLGELTDAELRQTVEQINGRRTLAQATAAQLEGAYRQAERLTIQMERQDMLLGHRLDLERMAGREALARLGPEATAEQRLHARLTTVQRTFDLERSAILENTRLTDAQRDLEMQRLELARQRAELEARATAAQERARAKEERRVAAERRAQDAAERRGDLRDQAIGAAGGMIAGAITGQGPSGAQMGSQIGAIAGQMIPVPGAAILAPTIGGLLGGLFDREQERPEQNPAIRGLRAIERAQVETIRTIQAQTDTLVNPENRLMNLPSNFNIPNYAPNFGDNGGGGGGTTIHQGDTHVALNFEVSGGSPDEVRRVVMDAVKQALSDGRRGSTWHAEYM